MRRLKFISPLILCAVFFYSYSPPAFAQNGKSGVRLKIDTDNFAIESAYKNYLSSFNLFTVVNGRQYLIAHIAKGIVSIPEPLLDPSAKYVAYAINTGCGFENEGMTIFVADIYGKKKVPILGSCTSLRPAGFLSANGKTYLHIISESESPEKSFWLYDLNDGQFVLHADGAIKTIGKDLFAYGQYNDEGDFKLVARVNLDTLITRGAPLKLLPRYPTQGVTQKQAVRVYGSENCYSVDDKPSRTIAAANTKVLVIMECEDGGYEIYLNGYRGKVRKGAIKPIDFGKGK